MSKKISYIWYIFVMEETIGSEKFTFGEVEETEYVSYEIVDS